MANTHPKNDWIESINESITFPIEDPSKNNPIIISTIPPLIKEAANEVTQRFLKLSFVKIQIFELLKPFSSSSSSPSFA